MPAEKSIHTEIGSYISTLLRDHFGKGPRSIYVIIEPPFITIHFRGFIAPMEKVLLSRNEWKRVLETRDLLMNKIKTEIIKEIREIAKLNINNLYADWNLNLETGLFLGVINEQQQTDGLDCPNEIDLAELEKKVEDASQKAQKIPGKIESYWLSERTVLVKRKDILVGIEKALIKEGYTEVLKLAKRPMERNLLERAGLEKALKRDIQEIFLDWDFENDIGYIVLILKTKN